MTKNKDFLIIFFNFLSIFEKNYFTKCNYCIHDQHIDNIKTIRYLINFHC